MTTSNPIPAGTRIGHVHLKVSDIQRALDFYCGVLGFELQQMYGKQAAFVSAGGYHHHMAMNVWKSRGAGVREQTLGLGDVAIQLPNADNLGQIAERLKHVGIQTRDDGAVIRLDDPWGNQVTLELQKA